MHNKDLTANHDPHQEITLSDDIKNCVSLINNDGSSQQSQQFSTIQKEISSDKAKYSIDELFLDHYLNYEQIYSRQSSMQPTKMVVESSETRFGMDNRVSPIFEIINRGKKVKKVNICEHLDKPHYAKLMCRSCYSKYGRVKKPWRCTHEKLYAQGLCQGCYTNTYNHMRRVQLKNENMDEPLLQ